MQVEDPYETMKPWKDDKTIHKPKKASVQCLDSDLEYGFVASSNIKTKITMRRDDWG